MLIELVWFIFKFYIGVLEITTISTETGMDQCLIWE